MRLSYKRFNLSIGSNSVGKSGSARTEEAFPLELFDFRCSLDGGVIEREESSNEPSSSPSSSSSICGSSFFGETKVIAGVICSINVKWGKSYWPIGRAWVKGGKSSSACPSSSAI